ncbi:MAG: polysaccharide pyruvyl transferase family protein [Deltaproteobacteria bacterium]|nr:polysaccharide pyruvyl transferase family protein [Candidatus Anaeroferrophillus wilburensis]MBN2889681.1 polysaccharide pyruvyl transferase family protein [Deltaproteobacteria bacterium]
MITVYDTACGSKNLGDQIIMESVVRELAAIFPHSHLVTYPTHYPLSRHALRKAWANQLAFVGGTNILRNKRRFRAHRNPWSLAFLDARRMTPAIFMGVGAFKYSGAPDWKARWFYQRALSHSWIHSVRDNYTLCQLLQMGVNNVMNTGCPTMWCLTDEHCRNIPYSRANNVIFTLTDYHQDYVSDKALVAILLKSYEGVFFWPQGSGDLAYVKKLMRDDWHARITIIPSHLQAFDSLLEHSHSLDYVGTRLHAGIRALQKSRRTIIVGIDNRALEKQRDFNLKVCHRNNAVALTEAIEGSFQTQIRLPSECIEKWKLQFDGWQQV